MFEFYNDRPINFGNVVGLNVAFLIDKLGSSLIQQFVYSHKL